jgi:hypothetical protein
VLGVVGGGRGPWWAPRFIAGNWDSGTLGGGPLPLTPRRILLRVGGWSGAERTCHVGVHMASLNARSRRMALTAYANS